MCSVSVVIPTHNRPELLVRALESVEKQTFTDYEIIVVDDGREPRAKEALTNYLNKPNFSYLETKGNQGAPIARNIGISAAKGEFVAFLDDDDEWLPTKLEIQTKALKNAGDEVGFSYTSVIKDKSTDDFTEVDDGVLDVYEQALTKFNGFLTITQMFRKNVLDEVGGFDESLPSHQDPELIIRVSEKYKALAINKPLAVIGLDDGREHIGGNIKKRIAGREQLLEKHIDKYKKHPKKLARLLFQLGLWYRELRDYKNAQKNFVVAFKKTGNMRYLLHVLNVSFKRKL